MLNTGFFGGRRTQSMPRASSPLNQRLRNRGVCGTVALASSVRAGIERWPDRGVHHSGAAIMRELCPKFQTVRQAVFRAGGCLVYVSAKAPKKIAQGCASLSIGRLANARWQVASVSPTIPRGARVNPVRRPDGRLKRPKSVPTRSRRKSDSDLARK
jgi:hypothetical protein